MEVERSFAPTNEPKEHITIPLYFVIGETVRARYSYGEGMNAWAEGIDLVVVGYSVEIYDEAVVFYKCEAKRLSQDEGKLALYRAESLIPKPKKGCKKERKHGKGHRSQRVAPAQAG